MKKILFIITIILLLNKISQAQVADTTVYLRDTIQANKAYYIGKPLNVLLTDLKIQVKSNTGDLPLNTLPETISFDRTSLYFSGTDVVAMRFLDGQKVPAIEIRFSPAISIPKAYLKRGALLDATKDWTQAKADFFGNFIISSLEVRGL